MVVAIIMCVILGIALLVFTGFVLKTFMKTISQMVNDLFKTDTLFEKGSILSQTELPKEIYMGLILLQTHFVENDGEEFLTLDLSHYENEGIIGISVGCCEQMYVDNMKKLLPNAQEEYLEDLLNKAEEPTIMGNGVIYCYEDGLWDYHIF